MPIQDSDFTNGDLIREARESLAMLRSELGSDIGRSEDSVALYETNRVNPPYSVKIRIARRLNLPVSALLS
jgi:DNA-binding XRE family transcriptional regulator